MNLLKKKNFYQVLTIFIWALFLFLEVVTGRLKIYLNKRFFPFTTFGLFILLMLFIIKLKRFRKEEKEDMNIRSSFSFLIFLFPVLLTLIVRPGTLPGVIAGKRGICQEFSGGNIMELLKAQLEMEGHYKKINIKQILALAKTKPEEINGSDVSVEGFVFKEEGTVERFMLVRFLITCCAADATPLGIEVLYNKTGELTKEAWVKVYGKCRIEEGKPVIIAEEIRETLQPADVYLY